jgi:hypothetical protein
MTNQYPNGSKWVARRVNLDREAYTIIKRATRERGLGKRGFSKTLRQIIHEWNELQHRAGPYPLHLD